MAMEVLEHLKELEKVPVKMFVYDFEDIHYSKKNHQVQCVLNYLTYWGEIEISVKQTGHTNI